MIIDFQHHYIPPPLAERHGVRPGEKRHLVEGGVPKFTLHDKVYRIEEQLQDMDEGGIDIAVLSCPLGWDASLEECQQVNDHLARVQGEYPHRFVGLAHVPALEGAAALGEMERAVKGLGLRGVTIMAQVQGKPLDARELWDFYAKAVELDIPIFVHPALLPKGYSLALDYDLARILGRELDLALEVTRVIAGGVLEQFPRLKLVFGHFGGGIAAIKERLSAKAFRFGTQLPRTFQDYFDLLYFDMAGFEGGQAALQCALTGIKPERLVFATDYPQDFSGVMTNTGKGPRHIRDYIDLVRRLDYPEEVKENILGGTAAQLLKLEPPGPRGLP